jgi:hypothetical protein
MKIKKIDGPERLLAVAVRLSPRERRDWCGAMLAELAQLEHSPTRWRFALGCAHAALFPPRKEALMNNMIKTITTRPAVAALVGLLLALPISLLLPIAVFEIEPFHSVLKHLFTEADGVRMNTLSQIVLIGSFALLPVALIISVTPIVQNFRTGKSVLTNPMNLLLSAALFLFIATVVGLFIVDQYPCWIGVPNCD